MACALVEHCAGNENEPLTPLTGYSFPNAETDDPLAKAVAAFCFPESVITHTTVAQYVCVHGRRSRGAEHARTQGWPDNTSPRLCAPTPSPLHPPDGTSRWLCAPTPSPLHPFIPRSFAPVRSYSRSLPARHVGSFYAFVMTEASGARMYGYCLRRLPKKVEHARERFAECVCFTSYQYGRRPFCARLHDTRMLIEGPHVCRVGGGVA